MTNKKINKITQIRFGQMNSMTNVVTQPSFDPSRVVVSEATRNSNENYYSADLLEGKCRWNGIIIRSTQQPRPWAASNFQRTLASYDRVHKSETYYSYKVFIAELDSFKQLPKKFTGEADESLINICRDALAPLGENYGPIDYGTPVQIVFEDQERGALATIVEVQWDRRIPLQGEDKASMQFSNTGQARMTVPTNPALYEPPPPLIEGCDEYFRPSTRSPKPRVLALGASFVSGDSTWAGSADGMLNLDRIAKGSMVLAGKTNSILSHLKANVASGCVKLDDYDAVIIFGGANGMGVNIKDDEGYTPQGAINALSTLLNYLRSERSSMKRFVITLHGWYGWGAESRLLADGSRSSVWSSEKRIRLMTATRKYNEWIHSQEGGLINGAIPWEVFSTTEKNSTETGIIKPGSRDWVSQNYNSGDGLHPGSEGHRAIAIGVLGFSILAVLLNK